MVCATFRRHPSGNRNYRTIRFWLAAFCCTLLLFAYFGLSPLMAMPIYNLLLFEPDRDGNFYPKTLGGRHVETVWFKSSDGNKIFGWYVHNPSAKKTVLLSHGNGGDLTDRAALISKIVRCGASVFAYDYEGFGLSDGKAGIDAACSNGLSAYDYLTKQRHVNPASLVLFGESLGTGVTCEIARHRQASSIILQSAFTSLISIAREHLGLLWLYPDALFPSQKLDTLSFLRGKHPPVLLVHGARDSVIPIGHALQLFEHAKIPAELVVLPDGHHEDMDTADANEYNTPLREFLAQDFSG